MPWASLPLLFCGRVSPPLQICHAKILHSTTDKVCKNSSPPAYVSPPPTPSAFPLHLLSTLLPVSALHICPPLQCFRTSAPHSPLDSVLSTLLLSLACCLGCFLHSQPVLAQTLPASSNREINLFSERTLQHSREDFTSLELISDLDAEVYRISSISSVSKNVPGLPLLDYAGVLNAAKTDSLLNAIHALEEETGWRVRVLTRSVSSPSVSGKELMDLWKPDDRTVVVIEDLKSPNILNFNTGLSVSARLPRQFFVELQSRYGNQFFVQQEGEGVALLSTVHAIEECLRKPDGCNNVPGLTNDLYYLTLAISIAGGCVFGFAARLPPSGRVEASWQWVLILSPLWLFLFVSFGVLPVIGRTTDLAPLLKNTLGFVGGAIAIYLTPILGPSPISKQ